MEERELQTLMMSLFRPVLVGEAPEPSLRDRLTPEVIEALYRLAYLHDLAHLLAASLEHLGVLNPELPITAILQKQQMLAIFRCEQLKFELNRLCAALREAEIPYIPLKGSVIRPYYPEPYMRTSCDIDILVPMERLEEAATLIREKLNYKREHKGEHDISMISSGGVHLELHFLLLEGDAKPDAVLARVWEFAEPDGENGYRLTNDFWLFYHIAHMAKHFRQGGCGVRPFMDLWIAEHRMGIDRHAADRLLDEAGLLKFSIGAFALTDAWFGKGVHNELSLDMQEYLMNAGVYGNLENSVAMAQTQQGGKLGHLVHKIFLSWKEMCIYYPSVKKFPPLFPIYQIRRWGRILFCGGVKRAAGHIKTNSGVTDECRAHMTDLRGRLGL